MTPLEYIEKSYANCLSLMKRKNADYATGEDFFKNLNSSDFVGVPPERAILVRMMDKMSRISNLLDKPPQVTEESINDALDDLSNYSQLLKAMLWTSKLKSSKKSNKNNPTLNSSKNSTGN